MNCKHQLGTNVFGRDDYTVQLKCLICNEIVSVNSEDFDEQMQREADDDLDLEPDEGDDDEDDFQPCDDCDLPDACADFGCAIKNGVRKSLLP